MANKESKNNGSLLLAGAKRQREDRIDIEETTTQVNNCFSEMTFEERKRRRAERFGVSYVANPPALEISRENPVSISTSIGSTKNTSLPLGPTLTSTNGRPRPVTVANGPNHVSQSHASISKNTPASFTATYGVGVTASVSSVQSASSSTSCNSSSNTSGPSSVTAAAGEHRGMTVWLDAVQTLHSTSTPPSQALSRANSALRSSASSSSANSYNATVTSTADASDSAGAAWEPLPPRSRMRGHKSAATVAVARGRADSRCSGASDVAMGEAAAAQR